MAKSKAWYDRYDELVKIVGEKKALYESRCESLGVSPQIVTKEIWNELIARAVKESNWQEGLELELDRTRELAIAALDELGIITEPHLDFEKIIEFQKKVVIGYKKKGATREEIGAYNLSTAYSLIPSIAIDFLTRSIAILAQIIEEINNNANKSIEISAEQASKFRDMCNSEKFQNALKRIEEWKNRKDPLGYPVTSNIQTKGEYFSSLLGGENKLKLLGIDPAYIHFLHKLILMGIYPENKTGKYRKRAVSVGRETVYFSPPSLIQSLMNEYCDDFTVAFWFVRDAIYISAELSYRFVSIHPYLDGNGRISRVLMNLILWTLGFPPVYLKADKKGRHRYSVALLRANKGNYKPLASLIAISLIEVYDKLYDPIKPSN